MSSLNKIENGYSLLGVVKVRTLKTFFFGLFSDWLFRSPNLCHRDIQGRKKKHFQRRKKKKGNFQRRKSRVKLFFFSLNFAFCSVRPPEFFARPPSITYSTFWTYVWNFPPFFNSNRWQGKPCEQSVYWRFKSQPILGSSTLLVKEASSKNW